MRQFASAPRFSKELIDTLDTKIAVWHSQLPVAKRDPLQIDGTVDEIMFMAHMIGAMYVKYHVTLKHIAVTDCRSVLMTMHRPLSSLVFNKAELSTKSFAPPAPFTIPASVSRNQHTARALRVLEIHTKLLAIPCAMEKHSVFSMCISAQIATAQISACNNLLEDHALSIARDRVKLSIGFLSAMGSIWAMGKAIAKDVRAVARSTLQAPPETATVDYDPSAEIELPRYELIWPINPSMDVDIYSGIVMPMDWEHVDSGYASSNLVNIADPKLWPRQS